MNEKTASRSSASSIHASLSRYGSAPTALVVLGLEDSGWGGGVGVGVYGFRVYTNLFTALGFYMPFFSEGGGAGFAPF